MVEVLSDDFWVQSQDIATCKLFVRRRVRADVEPAKIKRAVLFIHGTALCGSSFDSSAKGYSWQEYMATQGYAAYALDLRGYGRSKLNAAPATDKPFCRAPEAARDVRDVVKFIKEQTAAEKVDLVGYSWGTITAPIAALEYPELVNSIVLVAPITHDGNMVRTAEEPKAAQRHARMYGRGFALLADPLDPVRFDPAIGAYTDWSLSDIGQHGVATMLGTDPNLWNVPEVNDASKKDFAAVVGSSGDLCRSPSGAPNDLFDFYVGSDDLYEPERITLPTMIIRGELDFAGTHVGSAKLLSRMKSQIKQLVTIGNGGHNLYQHKCAPYVFSSVLAFLDVVHGTKG